MAPNDELSVNLQSYEAKPANDQIPWWRQHILFEKAILYKKCLLLNLLLQNKKIRCILLTLRP